MPEPITEDDVKSMFGECAELDFSDFHPLDHWAASPRCRSLPGGTKRHLTYWWNWQRPGWNRGWD